MELRVSFPGGKRVDVAFGDQVVRTDQPVDAGGDGSAPAPFELFLASIGACAGVYAQAFCQSRGIDPRLVTLTQRVSFDAATHLPTDVALQVVVRPGFPDKYVAALTRSVDQCKVKRTLTSPPRFTVNVVRSESSQGTPTAGGMTHV